jgi:hypothetical protein
VSSVHCATSMLSRTPMPHLLDICHSLDPVSFVRERLRFLPDLTQSLVLASRSKQVILNCTRQWGKSTLTAAQAVFIAWHEPESLILVMSPTARQSSELVRKAAVFLSRLGVRPRGDGGNKISLLLPNGSRIVGLPGNEATDRGFSGVRLLLVDEAARVNEALYLAMLPVLAVSGGDIWLMSTPYGRRGFFYQTCGPSAAPTGAASRCRPPNALAFFPPTSLGTASPWVTVGSARSTCANSLKTRESLSRGTNPKGN